MNAHTLEKLEFHRIREMLARHASCALGRDLANRIEASTELKDIDHWLTQLRQMKEVVTVRQNLPPFGGIRDVRVMVARSAPPSPLEPGDFAAIAETLTGMAALRKYFVDLPASADKLLALAGRIGDFTPISERIAQVVDDRGEVRDDASDRLRRIRIEMARTTEDVRRVFDKLLKQKAVVDKLQYASATFHNDRMVLPLRAEQRGRVPGIIHRSSDTGRTLFVEPAEAVELNNRRIDLKRDEEKEIGRLLWTLAQLVHANEKEILKSLSATAVVDLINAKVKFAQEMKMTIPTLSSEQRMSLRQARHPLLIEKFERQRRETGVSENVVPIDVRLGDDFDLLVVTGPNTGGKTAAIKTVGLLALMVQSGLPIPAESGAVMPVFDDVMIDVGDEQSLQQSLSTFSAHLTHIMDVLKRATQRSLVLLDELGAGTDPDEGAALGRALLDELLSRRCLTIVTTHLGLLKAVAFERPRVENAAVLFDIETLRPTYELRIGEPGDSNALRIAQRLGMPQSVLKAAHEALGGARRSLSKAIRGTLDVRRKAEQARREAEESERRSMAATEQLRIKQVALDEEARRFAKWTQRIKSLRPGDKVRLTRFDREGVIVRVKVAHQEAVVSVGAMEYEVPFTEIDVGE